ncbi:MAG: DUF2961 domain-containing protein [Armatimonadota bacterium]|nr:DUF2961 domain-containing protein [Armatimonadota bacterium]
MTILRAQKPDGTIGDVQMDAEGRLLVNDGLSVPQGILDYPHCGTPKTYWSETGAEKAILYLGAGNSGVVRTLWFTADMGNPGGCDWTQLAADNARLKIWTGLGTLADPEALPEAAPDVDIPLATILGGHYDPVGPTGLATRLFDAAGLADPGGLQYSYMLQLNVPIPFENGVLAQITSTDTYGFHLPGYRWAAYELGALPSWRYKDWRLRSASFSGAATTGQQKTLMSVADGPGMICGLWVSASNSGGNLVFAEGNWQFKTDGSETVNWETSGMEDIFGAEFYGFAPGVKATPYWGLTYKASAAYEAYRIFTRDPIIWSDGIVGLWQAPAFGGTLTLDTLYLYYAP